MFFAHQPSIFRAASLFLFCLLTHCRAPSKATYPEYSQVINLEISDDTLSPIEDFVWSEVVKVRSSKGWGTGTLFNLNGTVIAITAAHVVDDDMTVLLVDTNNNTVIFGDVIYNDHESDIAIIITSEIGRGLPLKFQHNVSGVGTDIFSVAHPNMHSKMLMRGEVVGYENNLRNFFILLQGFAWQGSSGASVFDEEGNLVGILSAIDVGRTGKKSVQLIPDVVWVKPAQLIDLEKLQTAINAAQYK